MASPRVSVLMAVFNGERFLREAVESVLNQTYTDFEFIIIDDGSIDATWAILSGYDDPRIRLVRNDENIGLTRSLNKGLALAQGEYVARMDADDVSLPERLFQQATYLDTYIEIGLLGTAYIKINEQGKTLQLGKVLTENEAIQERLLEHNCFCHGSVMFRRRCLDIVGGYRPLFETTQDYDLWLRITEHFKVSNLSIVLYKLRCGMESISVQRSQTQHAFHRLAQDAARARRQTGQDPLIALSKAEIEDAVEKVSLSVPPYRLLFLTKSHYELGDFKAAAQYLKQAQALEHESGTNTDHLYTWAVATAREMLEQERPFKQARSFLTWALRVLAYRQGTVRMAVSNLHMALVFESAALGQWVVVRRHIVYGAWLGSRWLRNRGVLSIAIQAFLGTKMTMWLKTLVNKFKIGASISNVITS